MVKYFVLRFVVVCYGKSRRCKGCVFFYFDYRLGMCYILHITYLLWKINKYDILNLDVDLLICV